MFGRSHDNAYIEQANCCRDVVLVVFNWLLSRFTDSLEGGNMDDTPDWIAFLLVVVEDCVDIGSILQVAWKYLDNCILSVLLGCTLWELVQGDLRDARQSGRV